MQFLGSGSFSFLFLNIYHMIQVQHLALGLVKPPEIPMGPLLRPGQVPLEDFQSFRCVNHETQLGVISKFAKHAYNPFICVTDEDIE
ncbi:hypothetical protein DUI87_00649 [Hirundo rustica rustica]|uniref:Uncharacterized protein n=1 Tax=Hirundo rustica rustica TaxID=333673 RepID=A0A3M0LTK3_HIRRU|nr:hypothetical protein DUI87_00649 [Hirundo rustica rustica]